MADRSFGLSLAFHVRLLREVRLYFIPLSGIRVGCSGGDYVTITTRTVVTDEYFYSFPRSDPSLDFNRYSYLLSTHYCVHGQPFTHFIEFINYCSAVGRSYVICLHYTQNCAGCDCDTFDPIANVLIHYRDLS